MTDTANHPQRLFAEELVARLRAAGHDALFAGGCVRDELLGRAPKDYDVATSALPDEVRELFGKKRTLAIGAAFGVISVLGPKGVEPVEVATFRSDAEYSDGRRPDGVRFTNAEEDASRRDFTINGLFFDPIDKRVIDYVGGQQDLRSGVVRAIGDAEQRFEEDKLRMLRAVRFAATLGFAIDPPTADAVRRHAAELSLVSAERIGAEVRRMLLDANRARAVELLADVRLLKLVLPELPAETQAIGERVASLREPSLGLALAATLFGFTDGPAAERVAKRLRFTKREGEHAAWLLANVAAVATAAERPWSAVQPVLANPYAGDLVAMHKAVHGGDDAASRFCRDRLTLPPEVLDPPPLVVGADLVAHGLRPGPEFGAWLAAARAAQLDGEAANKADALALIDRLRCESPRQ